jgi:hypothetical protein
MKNLTLFLSVLLLGQLSCKKDSGDQLPAATQTGAQTLGAMVNGQVFVAKNGSAEAGGGGIAIEAVYNPAANQSNPLQCSAYNLQAVGRPGILFTSTIPLQQGQTYNLQVVGSPTSNAGSLTASYFYKGDYYYIVAPLTGQLTIIRLDLTAKIFSGSFAFQAANSRGEQVTVTDGRFDLLLK